MHKGVEWIEGEVGIDITPCHDVDGTWNPGPDCRNFPKEPGTGIGDWQTGCAPGPVGGWSAICGEPYGDPDTTPPTVTITAPPSGMRFETGGMGSIPVSITASADDGGGFGVQDVRLTINGEEIPNSTDVLAPWEWPANFTPGQYTVTAIARDFGGNESESEPVYFGVDMDAPEPPAEEDTGGTGETDAGSETGNDGPIDGEAKGCGCRTVPAPGPGALAGLCVLAWLGWRRRR
jgi:MYXO-CTERM domain-containing protein